EEETFEEEQYEVGPDHPDDAASGVVKRRPLYRRPAFLLAAVVVLLVAVIFGLRYWAYARTHESTDDAFIDGHIVQVSPKVSGYVAKVYVTDNQQVKEGDLVAELDARDYDARLEAARAALAAGLAREREAQAGVSLTRATTRANVQQSSSGVQQARSGVESARAAAAAERSKIGQTSAGVATAQAGGAQAGVGEALGRLAQAGAGEQQVAVSQAQAETAGASIAQLRAAVEQAELELSYTKIYAPESGRVTRKAVEEGALVQPGQPLMAVVSGDVWVTANFKETQL